jgi:bis(5'-nucleosyl)-tetraphosphatase (symmetrical)
MATFAIGDIQGCYQELMQLLELIQFNSQKDQLWFTGDLINRGPQSLAVLRFIKNLKDKAISVLGNHDLHYLAVASGAVAYRESDTFQDVLNAPDRNDLYDWMRYKPLLYSDENQRFLLVHAGLAPQWDIKTAFECASEVEEALRGPDCISFLKNMYGNFPDHWDNTLRGNERLRTITNYFTRMRYLDKNAKLELYYKGKVGEEPPGCYPWFKIPSCREKEIRIIFGHWAALNGKTNDPHFFALDTGCCWGNCLTALRLDDLKFFSVKCNLSWS